ncbi:hypothetical protein D3C80_2182970 [compost metagenome]
MVEGESIKCAVNPLAGFESVKNVTPTSYAQKVLVIGAGPGGCQSTLSAAEAGHDVEIW